LFDSRDVSAKLSRFDVGAANVVVKSAAATVHIDNLMARLRLYSSIDVVIRR